jgi:uncharacterized protein involved in exopolysaccharide biosynthesis
MPDNYQLLSTQIDDLYQRLAALEAKVATLSVRLVPLHPAASAAGFDPAKNVIDSL